MSLPLRNLNEGILYDIENSEFPVRISANETSVSLGVYKNQDIASQVYATAKGIKGFGKLTPKTAEFLRAAYLSIDCLLEGIYVHTPDEVDDVLKDT